MPIPHCNEWRATSSSSGGVPAPSDFFLNIYCINLNYGLQLILFFIKINHIVTGKFITDA